MQQHATQVTRGLKAGVWNPLIVFVKRLQILWLSCNLPPALAYLASLSLPLGLLQCLIVHSCCTLSVLSVCACAGLDGSCSCRVQACCSLYAFLCIHTVCHC